MIKINLTFFFLLTSAKQLIKGELNVSYICSRYYRAPELIFGATDYTCNIGKNRDFKNNILIIIGTNILKNFKDSFVTPGVQVSFLHFFLRLYILYYI